MTSEELKMRGEVAKRIVNEPLLKEAFAAIEARAVEEMLKAPAFSFFGDRKRRRLADRINVIREVRSFLETAIIVGDQAGNPPRHRL